MFNWIEDDFYIGNCLGWYVHVTYLSDFKKDLKLEC